ncbi:MAG: hypothetical protein QG553_171 [Patescibacteria group bacterium]|nr:hypothetical protein [Patescibacteria group bacterium]
MAIAQEPSSQAHQPPGELFTPETSLAPGPQADQLANLPTLTDIGAPSAYTEFDVAETPVSAAPEQTKRRRLPAILAAGGVAIGLLAGSLLFNDDADKSTQVTAETTFTPPGEETDEPTSTLITPERNTRTGTIETGRIIPGEPTITAQLPGGREIIVPKPRTDGSPKDLYDSVLAAWACSMTSINKPCSDVLTDGDATRADELSDYYYSDIKPIAEMSDPTRFQVSVFDNPNNPVSISSEIASDGTLLYKIESGELFFNRTDNLIGFDNGQNVYGSSEWQDPSTRSFGPSTRLFSKFWINVGADVDGNKKVIGVYWESEQIGIDRAEELKAQTAVKATSNNDN